MRILPFAFSGRQGSKRQSLKVSSMSVKRVAFKLNNVPRRGLVATELRSTKVLLHADESRTRIDFVYIIISVAMSFIGC